MDDQAPRDPWHFALPAAELAAKGKTVLRVGRKQLALFITAEGPRACDNRCPHEGYPLSEGTLDAADGIACRLTCNWHNWKFDLASGANLTGGDALRVYPVEQRGPDLWVRIEEPPPAQRQAAALVRLDEALEDRAYDRMARELGRFLAAGGEPEAALSDAIRRRHARLEFGFGHAFAAAPDWLALRAGLTDETERLIPLVEILDHIAEDTRREPTWPYSEERLPWDAEAFAVAVEAEDETAAVARLNGALAAGLGFGDLEAVLTRAALRHYADFGHSLIYVVACGRLIAALGPESAPPLLRALVRSLVKQTREDLIPEFRDYAPALARFRAATGSAVPDLDAADTRRALAALAEAGGAPPEELFAELLRVNAANLRDFDEGFDRRWDRPVQDNAGWLDVTHGLTFAAAVLRQCRRFPELWPEGLLQMACFGGRNRRFRAKAPPATTVEDIPAFLAAERAALLDHGVDRPILSAHRLKTLLAGEALMAAEPEQAALLAAALARYLGGGVKGKHMRRSVRQALEIVARE